MEKYPSFFKGCKTSRNIISKKNIPSKYYTYCKLINNKWKESIGESYKYDKLFLRKTWIETQIPDFNYENNTHEDIKIAPPLIYLDDDEKFYDNDGNILEIEVRGEREFDKCYFKVNDIKKQFGIKLLHKTITQKNSGYVVDEHYVYFYLKIPSTLNRAKKLYLTYTGFSKIIESMRACRNNIKSMRLWLFQFNQTKYTGDYILLPQNSIVYGYTYCVTSSMINGIKIGYWTGTISALKSRYVTYYGNDIELHNFFVVNPHEIEKKFIIKFNSYKLYGELFKKKYLSIYLDFFMKLS